MKKLLFLLLGLGITLVSMEPIEGHKNQGRIERRGPSSGSIAPSSSSMPKISSTATVTSDGKSSSESSSLETEMAQIDLDKEGHEVSKKIKRRSLALVPIERDNLDESVAVDKLLHILEERERRKKQEHEETMVRLQTNDKQEKRKSVDVLVKTKHTIPMLRLADIEQGIKDSDFSDEELERIIAFIVQATGTDMKKGIKTRVKRKLKELHDTPPASPLFAENVSAIDALHTIRKLTNDHFLTTRVVESVRKKEQRSVHALQPADMVELESFEAGLAELLKLVNAEFAAKLTQTGKSRNIYRIASALTTAATVALTGYELYNKTTSGNDSTAAPTCPPALTNATFPL